ncbi:putative phosphatidate phosphatase [Haematobia irritans]|uniref:putative phosphatidate phosphatase n=1 Tax=Haematobia irritans TaxID=7368 RepID=UPI003F509F81
MAQIAVRYLLRLLLDFVLIFVLLMLTLKSRRLLGLPTKRGFFCGDESLSYPLHMDTISTRTLLIFSFNLPVAIIIGCGLLETLMVYRRQRTWSKLRMILTFHDSLLPFLFGYGTVCLIKELTKVTLGRLRPYFFQVCNPRLDDGTTCDHFKNHGIYIENYDCYNTMGDSFTGNYQSLVHDTMRTSFPSGHATLMFYGMGFMVYYLHRFSKILRSHGLNLGLFVPLAQCMGILAAWFVTITRILDYKHHWSDVVAGSLLGSSVAMAVAYYVHGHLKGSKTFLEALNFSKFPDTKSPVTNVNLGFSTETV